MLDILSTGFITGCTISVLSYGAVFFMLIKLGIQRGFRKGALFELGHVLSLVIIVIVVHFGLLTVNQIEFVKLGFSLIGGVFLIFFGYKTYKSKSKVEEIKLAADVSRLQYIVEGFLLNIINPFEFILWLGILSASSITYSDNGYDNLVFGVVAILSMGFIDLLKVYFAKILRKYITSRVYKIMNKTVGIIIIGIGISLIIFFVNQLYGNSTLNFITF